MKKIFSRFSFYFLILVLSPLVLSGCLPNANSPDGKNAEVDNTFVKGAAVKNFPPVPFYPKAQVIESYSSGENYGLSAVSSDDLNKVLEFYKATFAKFGWENTLVRQTENNYLFEFKSETNRGSVTVNTASDNNRTAISIVVVPR